MFFPKWRPVVAALLLSGLLLSCSSTGKPGTAGSVKPDKDRKAAPSFELKDADGRTVRLADYRGKVVLLNFWATWCGPCKMEIPWFMEFERNLKDRGFAVIGIAMDDEGWDVVKPFISEFGVNYRIVKGSDVVAQLYGGVEALPTSFLLDREGRIAAVHVGVAGKRDFEDGIRKLLD